MHIKTSPFWKYRYQIVIFLWFILGFRAAFIEIFVHGEHINNYLIYKNVFFNTIKQQNLYIAYPKLHADTNHYGPLFSLIIFPFAILPTKIGCALWCFFVMLVLFISVDQLQIKRDLKIAILLISGIEMQTAIHDTQFNPICAALIILSFILIRKGYLFWAALFVMIGLLVKLYGIVGICFIFFTHEKLKYVKYLMLCFFILLVLPMVISNPHFIYHSYFDWIGSIIEKDAKNIEILDQDFYQDISIMGFVRRVFNLQQLSNLYFLIPAALINIYILFRFKQSKIFSFQLSFLALLLIEVVVFSTSSEAASFIIASVGVGIWFALQKSKTNPIVVLLIFLSFFVSNFVSFHMLPKLWVESYYFRYSLKVIPYFLIWSMLAWQLMRKNFSNLEPSIIN